MFFHFFGKLSLPQTVYFSVSNFLYKLTQPTVQANAALDSSVLYDVHNTLVLYFLFLFFYDGKK